MDAYGRPLWKVQLTNYRKGKRMGKRGKVPANKLPTSKAPIPVKIVHDTPKAVSSNDDMKWRAEDAMRDLERAERHKGDPVLMKAVGSLAKEKMDSLKKFCK